MPARVSIVRCSSYDRDRVGAASRHVLKLLGGLGTIVKSGDRVLLKVNLLAAKNPDRGVTTHPELVRAVALEVRRLGATPVIGDSPAGAVDGVERFWNESGLASLACELPIELVSLEKAGVVRREIGQRVYHISRAVAEADVVINLPKLKTHNLTLLTLGIKNMFGIIPGLKKAEYHKQAPHPEDFSRLLVDIFSLAKPNLTILDAVVGMEGQNGPASGPLRELGFIAASTDTLALDVVASAIVGCDPLAIPTTRIAAERGLGESRLADIEVVGETIAEIAPDHFDLPSNLLVRLIPTPLVHLLGRFFWTRPAVVGEKCTQCLTCVESCPTQAMVMDGVHPVVDSRKCINCLCCLEVCAEDAVTVERSRLAKLIH